jgi:hypothetical protein
MSGAIKAYDLPIKINTGTSVTPVWTTILAASQYTVDPQAKEVNTTTWDDGGEEATSVVSRSLHVTIEGVVKEDAEGDLDPGLAALLGYANETMGEAVAEFLVYAPNAKGYRFSATVVSVNHTGGEVTDMVKWKADLKSVGAYTYGLLSSID